MTQASKPNGQRYFVLLQLSWIGRATHEREEWGVAFGDFSRSVVASEWQDYRDSGIAARNLKIITVLNATQAAVDAAVAKLNR